MFKKIKRMFSGKKAYLVGLVPFALLVVEKTVGINLDLEIGEWFVSLLGGTATMTLRAAVSKLGG